MVACGVKGVSRIEVLDGPIGRRRWPDDVSARIVLEGFILGGRVCDVAAKYGLIAHHLSGWRSFARKGELVIPNDLIASSRLLNRRLHLLLLTKFLVFPWKRTS